MPVTLIPVLGGAVGYLLRVARDARVAQPVYDIQAHAGTDDVCTARHAVEVLGVDPTHSLFPRRMFSGKWSPAVLAVQLRSFKVLAYLLTLPQAHLIARGQKDSSYCPIRQACRLDTKSDRRAILFLLAQHLTSAEIRTDMHPLHPGDLLWLKARIIDHPERHRQLRLKGAWATSGCRILLAHWSEERRRAGSSTAPRSSAPSLSAWGRLNRVPMQMVLFHLLRLKEEDEFGAAGTARLEAREAEEEAQKRFGRSATEVTLKEAARNRAIQSHEEAVERREAARAACMETAHVHNIITDTMRVRGWPGSAEERARK